MVAVNVDGKWLGMGRIPSPEDVRDHNFLMTTLLPRRLSTRRFKNWKIGAILDQQDTPHCVGFAWSQWEQTSPVRTSRATFDGNFEGHSIYNQCKLVDGYNGDGTWVRVGADTMRKNARLDTYVWAYNADDVAQWILEYGPVVVGTNWHEAMFYPNAKGVVKPQGEIVGGHAYMLYGYNRDEKMFRFANSWGATWGVHGRAKISFDDLAGLITNGGEAITAAELAR